jgi:peroxiredoxin
MRIVMVNRFAFAVVLGVFVAAGVHSVAATRVGGPAPVFTATDNQGKTHTLSDYKGKFVVLEWHNEGCPYVKKHYGSGNMQALQKEWTGKGVVWLTVVSSGPGQQGHVTAGQSQEYVRAQQASPTAVLLDSSGEVGRAYGAKTSPHMFVIDPEGVVIYNGAIDNQPTPDPATIASATNYVSAALTEAMSRAAVTTASTQPYGCSIKYAK